MKFRPIVLLTAALCLAGSASAATRILATAGSSPSVNRFASPAESPVTTRLWVVPTSPSTMQYSRQCDTQRTSTGCNSWSGQDACRRSSGFDAPSSTTVVNVNVVGNSGPTYVSVSTLGGSTTTGIPTWSTSRPASVYSLAAGISLTQSTRPNGGIVITRR